MSRQEATPPSPIAVRQSEGGGGNRGQTNIFVSRDDDMDETMSLNTTMMTDFSDGDILLDGESIIESIRKQEAQSRLTFNSIFSEPPSGVSASGYMSLDESTLKAFQEEESKDQLEEKKQRSVSFATESSQPAKHVKDEHLNAAQTPLTMQPAVISFSEDASNLAARVKAAYSFLECRVECIPSDEEIFDTAEFRICLLSDKYAQLTCEASVASQAAEAGRLIVIKTFDFTQSEGILSDEWKALCTDEDVIFDGCSEERFVDALGQIEKHLMERIAADNDEYAAVTQIDEYHVLEELGHGAQGVVYRAQHEVTSEVVAIKEIRNMAGKIAKETETEIAIMKKLTHPNVAKLIKVYKPNPAESTSIFLVLEFVPGGSLMTDSAVWNGTGKPLTPERAQNVFQQLVRGISYLHHMGVLHRDIKPSNVLGDRDHGIVKVSDFGVSSWTKKQKSARILGEDDIVTVGWCGTPAFLPPEACGAGHDVVYHGRLADVWSLGVTLYVLLCGHLPFKGVDRSSTAWAICESKLKVPSHVPSQAKDLLVKILEKNPDKRLNLAGVANHQWVNASNWSAEMNQGDLRRPVLSSQEIDQSLSLPQSIRKTIRKRSKSFVRYSGAFLSAMIPSPLLRAVTPRSNAPSSSEQHLSGASRSQTAVGGTLSSNNGSQTMHSIGSSDGGSIFTKPIAWLVQPTCSCGGDDRRESVASAPLPTSPVTRPAAVSSPGQTTTSSATEGSEFVEFFKKVGAWFETNLSSCGGDRKSPPSGGFKQL